MELGKQPPPLHNSQSVGADYTSFRMEDDKKAIYEHPLFPLLAILLEKCEMATTSNKLVDNEFRTFEDDVQAFIEQKTNGSERLCVPADDITELMIHALQVLQIHLMELQKVRDLCNEFCTRYVSNMKSKLAPERLIGALTEDELCLSLQDELLERQSDDGREMSNGMDFSAGGYQPDHQYQPTSRANPFRNVDQQLDSYSRSEDDGYEDSPPLVIADPELDSKDGILLGRGDSDDSQTSQQMSSKKQSKGCRGALPKPATAMLKAWIWEHKDRPYPTEDEKRTLAERGSITVHQINNWFINARRRILQPHLASHFRENSSQDGTKSSRGKRNGASTNHDESAALYSRTFIGLPNRAFCTEIEES